MKTPPRPPDEDDRLAALRQYEVLDTPPEESFDDLAALAASICEAPIALITLVDEDRQWFKSRVGLPLQETSRDISFCAHAINLPDITVVKDATTDARFHDNPLVTADPRIRFYAGAPLVTPEGQPLGTLCVIDRFPRELKHAHAVALRILSRHVMAQLELRRRRRELEHVQGGLLVAQAAHAEVKRLLESISDGFIAVDRQWNYVYVNARAAEIYGRRADELVGRNVWEMFPEGVDQPFRRRLEEAFARQKPVIFENYYAPWRRWFENRIHPTPEVLAILFQDITGRKRTEQLLAGCNGILELTATGRPAAEVLAAATALVEGLCPGLRAAVFISDDEGRRLRCGAAPGLPPSYVAAREDAGLPAGSDEPIEVPDLAGDDKWRAWGALLAPAGIRAVWSYPVHGPDRRLLGIFELHAAEPGRPGDEQREIVAKISHLAAICLGRDREQAALRTSEARLRLALDAAHMGVFDWDIDRDRITWNRHHERIWGFQPGGFGGTYADFTSRVHPDDLPVATAELERCKLSREPFEGEFRVVWADGGVHWVHGRGEFEYDEAGRPVRMRGAVVEITRRKAAELALEGVRDRLRALSRRLLEVQEAERRELARDLHDEVGQALTAVKINLQSIQRFPDARRQEALLRDSVDIIERTLNQTRALSLSLRPPMLDDLGLVPALRWFTDQQARRSGLTIRLEAPDRPGRFGAAVETACFRLVQEALTNVLRHASAREVRIHLELRDDWLQVEIRDDGRGFDPAATRRDAQRGASMGLHSMEERAALAGGTVEWETQPGQGTTVRFRLPVAAEPGPPPA